MHYWLLLGLFLALPSTSTASAAESTRNTDRPLKPPCIPFAAPKCCIDGGVCQCDDGNFYSMKSSYNEETGSCNPPGDEVYGRAGDIPGWCCN
ncbi:hypothetical protein BJ170DRAFT_610217 [Xylariales sp. AK1849]|nr:hypothetical protein BJ170DRAFT_610217 [Xylariales sp. AK1849]